MTTKVMDFQVEQVETYLQRAVDIRHGSTPTPTTKARSALAEAAAKLNRAGAMRAHLDVAIEAMAALISILYNADDDGQPANVDRATGRILVPLPWGRSGWRAWGVRQWEAAVLRSILMERATERRRFAPLFDYNAEGRTWHLNLHDYGSVDLAMTWIKKDAPSLAEWRTAVTEHRQYIADKMRKHRTR